MRRKFHWHLGLCCILLAGALAGCRREPAPPPTSQPTDTPSSTSTSAPTIPPPTFTSAPATETVYPPPMPTQPPVIGSPYPYPGALPSATFPVPATPYPMATLLSPVPTTPFPMATSLYPAPATPFPSPTSPYPVPPGGSQLPTVTQSLPQPTARAGYPAPGVTTPAPTPTGGGVPTPQLPTNTPGVLRSRIQATDPRTFQIVSGQTQLVMFFAYWSPESSSMAPVVNVLESRYKNRVRFVYLDVDAPENSLFQRLIQGRLLPLIFLLDAQGNVLQEWQGIVPAENLDQALLTAGG